MTTPNLGEPQLCGSQRCIKKTEGLSVPSTQSNVPEAHLERAGLTLKRFGNGTTMAKRLGLGTTHTTSSLLRYEHGGGAPGEEKVTVAWAVRESRAPKQTNADLGVGAQRWAVSVALPDIKSQLVDTVNVEWGRSNSTPLLNEEVTFRFHGSKVLKKNTANMILGDFYAFYSTPSLTI
ncbi:hypothetical protein B0H16DRAFT_1744786 [Mycena metata]|uniref:Uncharacterized protein n=1 Tax=Mycena metata TaxID=1033252 RepID=A0AAD7H439_9AGAR|nr:hypothetical protein B0H16DRAFT_1744786 [Mycena metata]